MTYQETIDYIFQHLPMFQRIGKAAYKNDLSTAILLDDYFDHPHKQYPTIHVAGTNGKGSVSHMIAAILQMAGYKTGLFTSPHLTDFRERIRVNGQMIPEESVISFIDKSQEIFLHTKPSFFEMTSAMAFYYFFESKVDIAVIEVGMGGRLDSTNIIIPLISIITNIGMDHTEFLGDTLQKIAGEKAGIIKQNIPVIIGEYHEETWPVFVIKAEALNSEIILADSVFNSKPSGHKSHGKQILNIYRNGTLYYENLTLDLIGFYQQKNISTVLAAIEILMKTGYNISRDQIYSALDNVQKFTGLRGRWQQLANQPIIICDTGHNVDGLRTVLEQIYSVSFDQLHMVIGFVNDKDIQGMLDLLPLNACYYFTNASIPRALNSEELKNKAYLLGLKGESYSSVPIAIEAAISNAGPSDMIYIGGSNFVVGEALEKCFSQT